MPSRAPFAQYSTEATSPDVVTDHETLPESVAPAEIVLLTSCAGEAVVVVVVVVGVGVVVVVVVVGVVVVVLVVVEVVVQRLPCDWGLQEAFFFPEANAAPPAKSPQTAIAVTTRRSTSLSEKCVFFMAARASSAALPRLLSLVLGMGRFPNRVQGLPGRRIAPIANRAGDRHDPHKRGRTFGRKGGMVAIRLVKLLTCGALVAAVVAPVTQARLASHGSLKISPRSLDFGAVRVGDSKSRTVTITNTGDEDVLLSAGWGTSPTPGPGFAFPTGDTCLQSEVEVLAAGESCTLTFTFSASSAGPAAATFVFSLDAFQSLAGSVSLAARGAG